MGKVENGVLGNEVVLLCYGIDWRFEWDSEIEWIQTRGFGGLKSFGGFGSSRVLRLPLPLLFTPVFPFQLLGRWNFEELHA